MHNDSEDPELAWQAFTRPADGAIYQHYKGGKYTIVATGLIEETLTPCIVYRSMENNLTWVRTAENFFEQVTFNGKTIPRFAEVN